LDHLLGELARTARVRLTLEVAPGSADEEVAAAGRALGRALAELLRDPGAAGSGWAFLPADEALASAAIEVADRPGFVSNVEFSGQRVGGIAERTEQVFANLHAILEQAGSSLDRLVKTTVFLQSLDDFAGMNEVYAKHVGDQPPARSTVEVAKLPSGALVEIEAIATL